MAACAKAVLQPDGSYLLGLDPTVTDTSTCAYVVITQGDQTLLQLSSLSMDDAVVISMTVGVLWAGAWVYRMLANLLSNQGSPYEAE
jgi:hypothetical protein